MKGKVMRHTLAKLMLALSMTGFLGLGASLVAVSPVGAASCTPSAWAQSSGTYLGAQGGTACSGSGSLNIQVVVQRCTVAPWGFCMTWDNVYYWQRAAYGSSYTTGWLWFTATKGNQYRVAADTWQNGQYTGTGYTGSIYF